MLLLVVVAMVRKKVDARVRTLIENGVKSNHRSTFVLVGDHGKDQASKDKGSCASIARMGTSFPPLCVCMVLSVCRVSPATSRVVDTYK